MFLKNSGRGGTFGASAATSKRLSGKFFRFDVFNLNPVREIALEILSFQEYVAGTRVLGLIARKRPDASDDLPEVASSFGPHLNTSSTLEGVFGERSIAMSLRSDRRRLPEKAFKTLFLFCFLSAIGCLGGVFSLSSIVSFDGVWLIGTMTEGRDSKTASRTVRHYVNPPDGDHLGVAEPTLF